MRVRSRDRESGNFTVNIIFASLNLCRIAAATGSCSRRRYVAVSTVSPGPMQPSEAAVFLASVGQHGLQANASVSGVDILNNPIAQRRKR